MLLKHMSGYSQGFAVSVALAAGFPWCPSCRQVTGPEFLLQLDTIFCTYITTMD